MRNSLSVCLGRGAMAAMLLALVAAPTASARAMQDPAAAEAVQPFSADQLDNLVAPVALYPDPLLAQVLLAATFPDQVVAAAQYVRANGTNGIDDQYWDVSVKAVAHYPTVLNLMDQRIDWTTSLGQAYAQQSSDVMQAVQHMRELARTQGNLESTSEQQVVVDDGYIRVWPAQPQVIYVPVYDPSVIYCRPVFRQAGFHAFFSFGIGYPIGAWLIYDWDWPARRIVYTGWYGGGWIARSRPFIRITNVYVNTAYREPRWNHDVVYRHPDYGHIRVYDGIGRHRADYGDHMHGGGWNPDAGRYAVPRGDGHGVVSASGGYRQPQVVTANEHARSLPASEPAPRRMPAPSTPSSWGRTAEPRRAAPAPTPMVTYRRADPAPAAPRSAPEPHVRYAPSAPRSAPPSGVRSAPRAPEGHAAPAHGESRSAHERHGHGGI